MQSKVKGPAIGLIALGALGVVLGILYLLGVGTSDPGQVDEQFRAAYELGVRFGRGFGAVIAAVSVFVAWAGLRMKRLEGWTPALIACLVVMTPLVGCGCFPGVPIGIWGLVVLFDSEVRAAFAQGR